MPDWLGLEWWRYAWGPVLTGGLVWLATTWKTTTESRGARDQRLDTRQEKWMATLDAEIVEQRSVAKEESERRERAEKRCDQCEQEKDRVWFAARRMERVAHDIRHAAHNKLMSMSLASNQPMPDLLPEVPALQSLLPKPDSPAA
jgi:hypothetical protein